jgi:hypothetical protein
LGQRRGLKNPYAREEDVFFIHPQNGLNGLILNWCTGGCWFTPAQIQAQISIQVSIQVQFEIPK